MKYPRKGPAAVHVPVISTLRGVPGFNSVLNLAIIFFVSPFYYFTKNSGVFLVSFSVVIREIRYTASSLSIRRFWGKRGKMEAKKGES